MKKTYTLHEFVEQAITDLKEYGEEWSGANSNEFHSDRHTWEEWWSAFAGYYSWEDR